MWSISFVSLCSISLQWSVLTIIKQWNYSFSISHLKITVERAIGMTWSTVLCAVCIKTRVSVSFLYQICVCNCVYMYVCMCACMHVCVCVFKRKFAFVIASKSEQINVYCLQLMPSRSIHFCTQDWIGSAVIKTSMESMPILTNKSKVCLLVLLITFI